MGRPRPDLDFDPVQWDAADWSRFTFAGMTLAGTNTYALTTPADGAGGIRRGRITAVAGAQGSDRRLYLLNDWAIDDRQRVIWWNKPTAAAGSAQVGHAHRVRLDDPDGWSRGWIVDHDFAFGTTANIRVNSWRWPPGGNGDPLGQVQEVGLTLPPLQRLVTATDAVRAGGTVTASGLSPVNGDPNGLVAGHTVAVTFPGDASYNGIFVVATAVAGATTATWAQAVGDDPGAGPGTLDDLDGVFPIAVESELIEDTLIAKAWRLGPDQAEPSWSDPTTAVKLEATVGADPFPGRPGRGGLYVGHLVGAGDFVEWGSYERGRYR